MTRETLEEQLTQDICEALNQDIQAHGKASLLVSGGSTPLNLFKRLSNADIDWSRVQISLVDERFLPDDHEDQNGKLVKENLLQNNAAAATFFPHVLDDADNHANLERVRQTTAELLRPFSVSILGMGGDGHTASLHPDAPELEAGMDLSTSEELIIAHPQEAPYERITFTRKALLNSKNLVLHLYGEGKQTVLEEARGHGDFHIHPIAAFLNHTDTPLKVYWAA